MKRLLPVIGWAFAIASDIFAHDPNGAPITWNREISRIVYERCASCHREGGTAFSLMTYQEEGGTTKGNNPNALPLAPKFGRPAQFRLPKDAFAVSNGLTLGQAVTVESLYPQHVPRGTSMQIVATLPDGSIQPLLWLYEFKDSYRHPFLFRKPLKLPPRTVIRGVAAGARIVLIPGSGTTTK